MTVQIRAHCYKDYYGSRHYRKLIGAVVTSTYIVIEWVLLAVTITVMISVYVSSYEFENELQHSWPKLNGWRAQRAVWIHQQTTLKGRFFWIFL